jgi:muramoyltetrapeptide carboxypeptidase
MPAAQAARVIKPKALKPGANLRVVTPASPLTREKCANFERLMTEAGFRMTYAPHAFDADHHLAGSDETRARDLQDAFDDPGVDAVICARGGYGCARLFPYLDLDRIAASGKLFAGFSDITTLHLALNRRGLATLHSPMPLTLSTEREPWVYESLINAMTGKDPIPTTLEFGIWNLESPPFQSPKSKFQIQRLTGGKAEGVVTGGCLILICDAIGTPDEMHCEGKIVILEDVDENPHRIDAMLTHLLNSNTIQKAAGIVVGEMTRTDEKHDEGIGGKPWREIMRDRLAPLGVPTITDFPFGHCKNMLSLPLGIRARLDADAGTLTYLEALCE